MTPTSFDEGITSPFRYTSPRNVVKLPVQHVHPSSTCGLLVDEGSIMDSTSRHPVFFGLRSSNNNLPVSSSYNGFFVMTLQGNKQMQVDEMGIRFTFEQAAQGVLKMVAAGQNKFGIFDLTGFYDCSTCDVVCQKAYRPVAQPAPKSTKKAAPPKRTSAARKRTSEAPAAKSTVAHVTGPPPPGVESLGLRTARERRAPKRLDDFSISPSMKICQVCLVGLLHHLLFCGEYLGSEKGRVRP